MAYDPKDGSVYFGRGTTDFTNAYSVDKDGKARYSLKDERGTIIRVFARLQEPRDRRHRHPLPGRDSRSTRPAISSAATRKARRGCPNGNPLDELLHIQKGRHYGFPPRHPKHLPDVIDEPSTFDYGPQHQSTCGFCFNEPVKKDGPTFGPKAWAGDVIMTGESRGKLYRTQLVKTDAGYVAKNQLIACLNMLTVDCCVAPDGSLVVACHSGPPDWGTRADREGEALQDQLHRPRASAARSRLARGPARGSRRVRPAGRSAIASRRARADEDHRGAVRAGRRPVHVALAAYAVVQAERTTPRFNVRVHSAQLPARSAHAGARHRPAHRGGALRGHPPRHGPAREGKTPRANCRSTRRSTSTSICRGWRRPGRTRTRRSSGAAGCRRSTWRCRGSSRRAAPITMRSGS